MYCISVYSICLCLSLFFFLLSFRMCLLVYFYAFLCFCHSIVLFVCLSLTPLLAESLSSFLPAHNCYCTHSHSQPLRGGSSLSAAGYRSWAMLKDTHTLTHICLYSLKTTHTHTQAHIQILTSSAERCMGPEWEQAFRRPGSVSSQTCLCPSWAPGLPWRHYPWAAGSQHGRGTALHWMCVRVCVCENKKVRIFMSQCLFTVLQHTHEWVQIETLPCVHKNACTHFSHTHTHT